jgi:insulysin
MAGLEYSLESNDEKIILNVSGYNDKLAILLAKVVDVMQHLTVKKQRFDVFKDALLRALKNWKLSDPGEHAQYYREYLLTTGQWTNDEAIQALEGSRLINRAD